MDKIQQMKETFFALPIEQKEKIFWELEWNLLQEKHNQALHEDIEIVHARLERLDAGIDKPIPWDEAMARLFPKA